MAKIFLNIEAVDAADLQSTLSDLAGVIGVPLIGGGTLHRNPYTEDAGDEPVVSATEAADAGEPQRRRRRTKAEMAADNAAQGAAVPLPPTPSPEPPAASASASSTDGDEVVTDETVGAVMASALGKLKEQGKTAMDLREVLINSTKHLVEGGASNRTALNTPELRAAAVAGMRALL